MKVTLEELLSPKTIEIKGDEEWLADLYKSFAKSKKGPAKLTGKLLIQSEGYGYAKVEGEVTYEPIVPCSRCADPINWPIKKEFVSRFKPKDETTEGADIELMPEDLDFYYIEDNSLDIQQLVIDVIMTSLPSQLVVKSDDGKSCRNCGVDLNTSEVYSTRPKEDDSPFAVLKNMKLPN